MSDLKTTSLLADFAVEPERRIHSVTNEPYSHLRLGGKFGAEAQLFDDGMVVVVQGGLCVSLDDIEAMHLANAILAHSQAQNQPPCAKPAGALQSDEAHREFLDSVEGDNEYAAHVERKAAPTAEHY